MQLSKSYILGFWPNGFKCLRVTERYLCIINLGDNFRLGKSFGYWMVYLNTGLREVERMNVRRGLGSVHLLRRRYIRLSDMFNFQHSLSLCTEIRCFGKPASIVLRHDTVIQSLNSQTVFLYLNFGLFFGRFLHIRHCR